jgi:hypothetical protein
VAEVVVVTLAIHVVLATHATLATPATPALNLKQTVKKLVVSLTHLIKRPTGKKLAPLSLSTRTVQLLIITLSVALKVSSARPSERLSSYPTSKTLRPKILTLVLCSSSTLSVKPTAHVNQTT